MTISSLDRIPAARRAGTGDRADVAQVLTSAFVDDPVTAWIVPDRSERQRLLPTMFGLFAGAFAAHDETHLVRHAPRGATGGPVAGAALWAPPGAPTDTEAEATFADAIAELAGPHIERFAECSALFAAAHPEEPAWYLQFLGVHGDLQGRGFGSVLLREVLSRADAAGEAAYLEATSPRNRALYERHGFRGIADIPFPGGPTAYAMWRDPGSVGS